MRTKRCVHRVWFNLFLQTVKTIHSKRIESYVWCSVAKMYGNKLHLKFSKNHGRNTKNCHSKVKCNSSYFKLSVFQKAKVGYRNKENETFKFDKNFVLKFRILITSVK